MNCSKVLEGLAENHGGVTLFSEHLNSAGKKYLKSIDYYFSRHDLWNWIKRGEIPVVPAFILAKILDTHPIVFNFSDCSILYSMDERHRASTIKNFKLLSTKQRKELVK